MREKTICLNMIVKNENRVIERCLASVKNIIDYWVIVDTGSTDGTQKVIKEFMKDKPGELHERPWVNFEYNRNEALEFAKGKADYLLFIDADEVLKYPQFYSFQGLDKDRYFCTYRHATFSQGENDSFRTLLINTKKKWIWKGIIHEGIDCQEEEYSNGILKDVLNLATAKDGARSLDPNKLRKDIKILEEIVEKDPQNSRDVTHLAITYSAAKEYALALKTFEKRATMGDSDDEVYFSLQQIGPLQQLLEMPPEIFIGSYLKAYHYRPSRMEPLYYLTNYFIRSKQYLLGYILSKHALSINRPLENFFTQFWMYEWGILTLFAECSLQLKKNQESLIATKKLIKIPSLPPAIRTRAEDHLKKEGILL